MSYLLESLRQLIGLAPSRPAPDERLPEVVTIYAEKRKEKLTKEKLLAAHRGGIDTVIFGFEIAYRK